MMLDKSRRLWESLENEEYRREYSADIGTGLAFQIKLLREKKGWTQDHLAKITDKQQETISQWEDPDYGNYTLNTLKSLAAAFDVALVVKFAPFSELVEWMSGLTPERLTPPSFKEEAQTVDRWFAETSSNEASSTMDVSASAKNETVAEQPVSTYLPGLVEAKTEQKEEVPYALAS